MEKVIVRSGRCIIAPIGLVHVKIHAAARGLRARWHLQELCVTLPKGTPLSYLERFIQEKADEILSLRPQAALMPGAYFEGPLADFSFIRSDVRSNRLTADIRSVEPLRGKQINYTINVPKTVSDEKLAEADWQNALNGILTKCAANAATRLLIPIADAVAHRLGCKTAAWSVSSATRRFGSCSGSGRITLSPKLIFVEQELVEYVVCHELAHLTHMNHSAAFHRLCNAYCGGREDELRARLDACAFPIR